MTEIELQLLLEQLYNETFLDCIKIINEKESIYKKSEFFKQTKIPLSTLYEKYFIYANSKYSIEEKLNDFITKIDTERLADLSLDWIDQIEKSEKFNKVFDLILQKFDLSRLQETQQEIEELVSDIKPK